MRASKKKLRRPYTQERRSNHARRRARARPRSYGQASTGSLATSSRAARGRSRRSAGQGRQGSGEGKTGGGIRLLLRKPSTRLIILFLLLGLFLGVALKPTLKNLETTSELKGKELELERQQGITVRLGKKVQEARTEEYMELKAREQGLIYPDETLYVITSEAERKKEGTEKRIRGMRSMEEAWEWVSSMMSCNRGLE